jgi:hypothetical protein
MKKLLAIVGAIITGGLTIISSNLGQSASAGLALVN